MVDSIHHIATTAQNLQETIDFYSKLGFTVESRQSLNGSDRAMLKLGEVMIEVFCPKAEHPPPRLGIMHIGLGVADIQKAYTALVDKGVNFQTAVLNPRPGIVVAHLKDPNGVSLHLHQT